MMAASPAVQSHHPIPQRGTQPPPTRQTKPTRSSTPIQVDDDDRKDEGLTSDDANLDGSGNVSSSSSDSPLAELAARGPTPARTAKASSPHLAASNPPAIASTSSSWLSAFASDPAAWQVYLSHAKALINDTANSSPQHAATGLAALDTFQPAQPPAKIGQAPPAVKLKFVKLLAQAKSDQFFDELAVLEDERERLVDTLVDWLTNALDVVEKAPEGDVKKLGPDDATAYECALPLLKVSLLSLLSSLPVRVCVRAHVSPYRCRPRRRRRRQQKATTPKLTTNAKLGEAEGRHVLARWSFSHALLWPQKGKRESHQTREQVSRGLDRRLPAALSPWKASLDVHPWTWLAMLCRCSPRALSLTLARPAHRHSRPPSSLVPPFSPSSFSARALVSSLL